MRKKYQRKLNEEVLGKVAHARLAVRQKLLDGVQEPKPAPEPSPRSPSPFLRVTRKKKGRPSD